MLTGASVPVDEFDLDVRTTALRTPRLARGEGRLETDADDCTERTCESCPCPPRTPVTCDDDCQHSELTCETCGNTCPCATRPRDECEPEREPDPDEPDEAVT